jgi:Ni/Fe-hydrogenase subunit HybB-like protein
VALAAGGFTTAFLAHIVSRHYYEPIVRPALLTAMLGYTFVVLGLLVDIGRSWAIWKPMIHWNPHSVLFEVAMCVMLYLNVLYLEFAPIVVAQYKGRVNLDHRRGGALLHAPVQPGLFDADCAHQTPSPLVHADPAAALSDFGHRGGLPHGGI